MLKCHVESSLISVYDRKSIDISQKRKIKKPNARRVLAQFKYFRFNVDGGCSVKDKKNRGGRGGRKDRYEENFIRFESVIDARWRWV